MSSSTTYYDIFYDKLNNNLKLFTVLMLVILIVIFLTFALFFFVQIEEGGKYRTLNIFSGSASAFFSVISMLLAVYQWFFVEDVYKFFDTKYILNMPEFFVSKTTGDQLQNILAVKKKSNSNVFIIDFDHVYRIGKLSIKPTDVLNREEIEVRMTKKNHDLYVSTEFNFDAIAKFYDRFSNRVNQKMNEKKLPSTVVQPPPPQPLAPEKKFFTRQQTTIGVTNDGNIFPL